MGIFCDLVCNNIIEMVYNDICSMTSKVMVFVINSLFCHEKMSLNMFQSLEPPWCGASSYVNDQYKGMTSDLEVIY
jgi:hypothetical protein